MKHTCFVFLSCMPRFNFSYLKTTCTRAQVGGVSTLVAVSTCGSSTQVEVDLTVWPSCPDPWAALRAYSEKQTSSATTVSVMVVVVVVLSVFFFPRDVCA